MVDLRLSLIYRALVALDHEVTTCGAQPSQPGPAVRFALAYLYAARIDQKREPFDGFWKALIAVDSSSWSDHDKRYARRTALHGWLSAIIRSLGLPATPGLLHSISQGDRAGGARQSHVRLFWQEVQNYHLRGVPARKRPPKDAR